jgi:hypothetical protein
MSIKDSITAWYIRRICTGYIKLLCRKAAARGLAEISWIGLREKIRTPKELIEKAGGQEAFRKAWEALEENDPEIKAYVARYGEVLDEFMGKEQA